MHLNAWQLGDIHCPLRNVVTQESELLWNCLRISHPVYNFVDRDGSAACAFHLSNFKGWSVHQVLPAILYSKEIMTLFLGLDKVAVKATNACLFLGDKASYEV